MTTLLKLRGLARNANQKVGSGAGQQMLARGFRIKSALSPSVTGGTSARATRTIGTSNAAVTYTAKVGGARGNDIRVAQVVDAGTVARSVVVTYDSSGRPTVTVNLATTGGAVNGSETASAIAAAVNADLEASQFVTAAAGGTGASVAVAGAAGNLSGGSNGTGTAESFYQTVNQRTTVVVDLDDPLVERQLLRNRGNFVSLGQP